MVTTGNAATTQSFRLNRVPRSKPAMSYNPSYYSPEYLQESPSQAIPKTSDMTNAPSNIPGKFYDFRGADGVFSLRLHSAISNPEPTYVAGSSITGTISFDLRKPQRLRKITIALKGKTKSALTIPRVGDKPSHTRKDEWLILDQRLLLWDERNLQGFKVVDGKLDAQTYTFDFSFQLPVQGAYTRLDTFTDKQVPYSSLPPSFFTYADNHAQGIIYYLKVEADRVGLHFDHELRVPVLISPLVPAVWRSPLFLQATHQGNFPPGPDVDPQGWVTFGKEMHLKKTFGGTLAKVNATFSIPNPATYPVGVSLPFVLTLAIEESHKDDKIIKEIKLCLHDTVVVSVSNRREKFSSHNIYPLIGQVIVGGSRKTGVEETWLHSRDGSRIILGEFPLNKHALTPDFRTPNFSLCWGISIDFDVPGLGNDQAMSIPLSLVPFPEGMRLPGHSPELM